MSIVNGVFNAGSDQSVTIVDSTTNAPIDFGGELLSFKWTQKVEEIVARPIGTYTQKRQWYDGHDLKIMVLRQNGALDVRSATVEAEYYAQIAQRAYTVTQTVVNPADGSTTENRFLACTLAITDHGEFEKTKDVQLEIVAWAQTMESTNS